MVRPASPRRGQARPAARAGQEGPGRGRDGLRARDDRARGLSHSSTPLLGCAGALALTHPPFPFRCAHPPGLRGHLRPAPLDPALPPRALRRPLPHPILLPAARTRTGSPSTITLSNDSSSSAAVRPVDRRTHRPLPAKRRARPLARAHARAVIRLGRRRARRRCRGRRRLPRRRLGPPPHIQPFLLRGRRRRGRHGQRNMGYRRCRPLRTVHRASPSSPALARPRARPTDDRPPPGPPTSCQTSTRPRERATRACPTGC